MDSLVASHALETGAVKDILVEGVLDHKVITRIKSQCSCSAPPNIVRVDQDLELPSNFLQQNGCANDNRGLVVAVVRHIKKKAGSASRILGIIDRDFDDFIEPRPIHPDGILRTDFANLEMYFNSREVIENICLFGFGVSPMTDAFYNSFLKVLLRIYCIRLAKKKNSVFVSLELDQYRGFLRIELSRLLFDENRFFPSWLSGKVQPQVLQEFPGKVDEVMASIKSVSDARYSIHGHDFTALLSWLCAEMGGAQIYRNQAAIPGLLASTGFRDDFIERHELFRSIGAFIRN
ncbi:MAG: hypothetical protein H0W78_04645 [Planctomycetes bacterium]|nr:hypothetical protein [Planctomycetota bacterium]